MELRQRDGELLRACSSAALAKTVNHTGCTRRFSTDACRSWCGTMAARQGGVFIPLSFDRMVLAVRRASIVTHATVRERPRRQTSSPTWSVRQAVASSPVSKACGSGGKSRCCRSGDRSEADASLYVPLWRAAVAVSTTAAGWAVVADEGGLPMPSRRSRRGTVRPPDSRGSEVRIQQARRSRRSSSA